MLVISLSSSTSSIIAITISSPLSIGIYGTGYISVVLALFLPTDIESKGLLGPVSSSSSSSSSSLSSILS